MIYGVVVDIEPCMEVGWNLELLSMLGMLKPKEMWEE